MIRFVRVPIAVPGAPKGSIWRWLLDVGCRMLDVGFQMSDVGVGCRISILGFRFWDLDFGLPADGWILVRQPGGWISDCGFGMIQMLNIEHKTLNQ